MLFPILKDLIKLKTVISYSGLTAQQSGNRTQGDYTSLFHGLGVEFESVRPYVIGDDVRHIDWRVTARIGKPQVKTFRAEIDRNVLIVVDANAYMRFGTRGTFKSVQAATTAALLSWKSLQQQDRVGGLVFGDISNGLQYFKPTKTDSAVLRMLKLLCNTAINAHEPMPVATALDHLSRVATPQSLIFIISDFSMEAMPQLEKSLLTLRKKCKLILLPVCDPSDSDIPDAGSIIFASGKERALIATQNLAARKKYRAAWDSYKNAIVQLSKRLKTPLLWIETSLDPVKCLFANKGSLLTWKN